nr:pilus assembly protein TadG-related protein [Planosporangium flavigriseum]
MRSLVRRRLRAALTRSRLRGERGNVTVLVAIVLGGGVLMGASAIAIDVGQLYAEREELQSGADAAAMAVAQNCIRTPSSCGNQTGTALSYAGGNAKDGASAVTAVCGRATGLPACPAPAGTRADCLGGAPSAGNYVELRTATQRPDGSTLLPPTFAQTLLGNDGYQGTRIAACARVAWGPPLNGTGLAVTASTCEWNQMTGGAPGYWPPGTVPPTSAEGIIYLHGGKGATTCPAGPSGWDAPGGFGWLDDPNGNCTTTVSASGSYGGNTGVSASKPCKTALEDLYASHKSVLIPIYDGVKGNGANTTYHLSGFSSFVLTGYALSGLSEPSWLSGRTLCSGSDKCLYGYFTTAILPSGGSFGTVDYGTTILKMVG